MDESVEALVQAAWSYTTMTRHSRLGALRGCTQVALPGIHLPTRWLGYPGASPGDVPISAPSSRGGEATLAGKEPSEGK